MADSTEEQSTEIYDPLEPVHHLTAAGDIISGQIGDNAENVAVGKNILQIGSLTIPRWAALIAVAALALVAVLAGALAYFSWRFGTSSEQALTILSNTPTPTLTITPVPTATPTALPFAPAAEGETMIVVLPFHTTTATDTEPHKKIWRRIRALLAEMPNTSISAVIDPNTVLTADQKKDAEAIGRRYNASMVIWGEDTGVEVIANFLNIREPNFAAANVDIDETQRTQLANPSQYAEFVTRDLPGQLAFLALFAVGQTYYLNGDYPGAIDLIKSATAEAGLPSGGGTGDPATALLQGLADAYFRLGWLYQQTPGQLEAAIGSYDKAIELTPEFADAYNNRGDAHRRMGDLDQAMVDYNQAIHLDPQDADAYNNRGYVYYTHGELDQAIADYTQAIALEPDFVFAHNNRANVYLIQNDFDQAIADYSRAIELDPGFAEAYNHRGVAYRYSGDFDQAIADYTKAIELDPDYSAAYNNRATAYRAMGNVDQAIADYTKALELDPNNAVASANLCGVYKRKGDLNQAIAYGTRAIELDPKLAFAYTSRADAYAANGDLAHAIADYTKASALNPKSASTYNSLCWYLALQQQPQQALTYCDKAVSLSDEPGYIDSRGLAHALLGEYDAAAADFQLYVDWLMNNSGEDKEAIEERKGWIESLQRDENPFTPAVLESLK